MVETNLEPGTSVSRIRLHATLQDLAVERDRPEAQSLDGIEE